LLKYKAETSKALRLAVPTLAYFAELDAVAQPGKAGLWVQSAVMEGHCWSEWEQTDTLFHGVSLHHCKIWAFEYNLW